MRPLTLFLLLASAATAGPFHFGVKGGVPLTSFVNTVVYGPTNGYQTSNRRYIVGPTVELSLPHGLAIEADALYRRFSYTSFSRHSGSGQDDRTTGNAWEFPLLAKYRFAGTRVRPYVDAGVAWNALSGLNQTRTTTTFDLRRIVTTISTPGEVKHRFAAGFAAGAGLDVHALFFHVSPEIRYTRWATQNFSDGGSVETNRNQAEVLLGITF
jgi:hypothetical protein